MPDLAVGTPVPSDTNGTFVAAMEETGTLGAFLRDGGMAAVRAYAAEVGPPRLRSLYDIGDDLSAIHHVLTESQGVVPDDRNAVLDAYLSGELGEEQAAKLERYGWAMREMEARATAWKERAAYLAARAKRETEEIDRMKRRLTLHLLRTGQKEAEAPTFRFRLASTGKRKMEWLVTEARYVELPGYLREQVTSYKPLTDAIYKAVEVAEAARLERLARAQVAVAQWTDRGRWMVEQMAEGDSSATARLREYLRNGDPGTWLGALSAESMKALDTHFPPTEAEEILKYAALKPKDHHLRID